MCGIRANPHPRFTGPAGACSPRRAGDAQYSLKLSRHRALSSGCSAVQGPKQRRLAPQGALMLQAARSRKVPQMSRPAMWGPRTLRILLTTMRRRKIRQSRSGDRSWPSFSTPCLPVLVAHAVAADSLARGCCALLLCQVVCSVTAASVCALGQRPGKLRPTSSQVTGMLASHRPDRDVLWPQKTLASSGSTAPEPSRLSQVSLLIAG